MAVQVVIEVYRHVRRQVLHGANKGGQTIREAARRQLLLVRRLFRFSSSLHRAHFDLTYHVIVLSVCLERISNHEIAGMKAELLQGARVDRAA